MTEEILGHKSKNVHVGDLVRVQEECAKVFTAYSRVVNEDIVNTEKARKEKTNQGQKKSGEQTERLDSDEHYRNRK